MPTIVPYKEIFISQPTGEGGVLIQSNFKKLADLNEVKTSQIASITANYSLKTETLTVSNSVIAETSARIDGDTILSNKIDDNVTNLTTLTYAASANALAQANATSLSNAISYSAAASANALSQAINSSYVPTISSNGYGTRYIQIGTFSDPGGNNGDMVIII